MVTSVNSFAASAYWYTSDTIAVDNLNPTTSKKLGPIGEGIHLLSRMSEQFKAESSTDSGEESDGILIDENAQEKDRTAILLLDFQNEFVKKGGKLHDDVTDTMEKTGVLQNVPKLVEFAR